MGANYSKPGQRARQNKSNPPPAYSKGVTTTATPNHDGPQKPGTKGPPVGPERPGEQCTAELVARVESLERAVSELQGAGAPEPFAKAMLTSASQKSTAGTQGTIEDQREALEKEKESLKEQKRNLEEQKSRWGKEKETLEKTNRSLEKDKKYLEEQKIRLEERLDERQLALERSDESRRSCMDTITKQSVLIEGQVRKIRELRDDLQEVSTEALKAKVLSGKGNDQAVSVAEPCNCTQHPGS